MLPSRNRLSTGVVGSSVAEDIGAVKGEFGRRSVNQAEAGRREQRNRAVFALNRADIDVFGDLADEGIALVDQFRTLGAGLAGRTQANIDFEHLLEKAVELADIAR